MDAERRNDEQVTLPPSDEQMRYESSSTGVSGRDSGTREIARSDETTQLLADEDSKGFLTRWEAIQTKFVDEPNRSVQEADQLVGELMNRLTTEFSEARSDLESRWEREDEVSTEDLRMTLQRYRSFFQRLLAA
jgi:hypothetical protein